jgi:endonuclease G, mitochondrial
MRRAYGVAVLLLSVLLTHAQPARTPAAASREERFAARLERHCYNGCPKIDRAWRRGETVTIARGAYSIEVSTTVMVPFWSAEFVTAAEVEGDAGRSGYRADPALRDEPHSTLNDYKSSDVKYDVGHQAPAANHKRSQNRMDETFYLSNMAPQIPAFNRGIWKKLETDSRKWIARRGRAYCITGPVFFNGREVKPDYQPRTIGRNKVAVPTHFYKIIVAPRARGSSEMESIAFLLQNKAYPSADYKKHITSISRIEQLTGINFMPALSASERDRLERDKAPAAW